MRAGDSTLADVSDADLIEFCIGENIVFLFPQNFWKADKHSYTGQVIDSFTRRKDQVLCAKIVVHRADASALPASPLKQWLINVPVSQDDPKAKKDISLRAILRAHAPGMQKLWDLAPPPARNQSIVAPQTFRHKVFTKGVSAFVSLVAVAQMFLPLHQLQDVSDRVSEFSVLRVARHFDSPMFTYCALTALHDFSNRTATQVRALPPEPPHYHASLKRPDSHHWRSAEDVEMATLDDVPCFDYVDAHTVPPDAKFLPLTWSYKLKLDQHGNISRYKARACARGDLQTPDMYEETFSPTSRFAAMRTVCSLACQNNYFLKSFDIQAAFVTADVDKEIYVRLPPGFQPPPGKVAKMRRALYGLRQSSHLYHAHLSSWLTQYGFQKVADDSTLWRLQRGDDVLLLSVYVDDGLVACSSEAIFDRFLQDFSKEFRISAKGDLQFYLGICVDYNRTAGTCHLHQSKYCTEILTRFDMNNCRPTSTPFLPNSYLTGDDCCDRFDPDFAQQIQYYQQLVGALLYLSNCTRPDISFAVNQCARFMCNPGPSHITAAKRILRYLCATQHLGLTYRRVAPTHPQANTLFGYVDADHAGCPETRLSVSGYVHILHGAAVSWASKRQHSVALSSTEAEFYSASLAGCDVEYLRFVLDDLGFPQATPTVLFEDNQACIYMSRNKTNFAKSKHIDTRVHRLRQLCADGILRLVKVDTSLQAADALTKGLPIASFERHRDVMLGT